MVVNFTFTYTPSTGIPNTFGELKIFVNCETLRKPFFDEAFTK